MSISVNGSVGIKQNTTEVTKIPVGTTAQRPANPEAGMIRFNTDTGQVEGYNAALGQWQNVNEFFVSITATGGTVTDITQDGKEYRVHTFTSDGTFEVTAGGGEVEYLVVGGGGGARGRIGNATYGLGGGGAGGYRSSVSGELSGENSQSEPPLSVTAQMYSVIVGDGGAFNVQGEDSSLGSIVSIGGGRGGITGGDGGSGGGASRGSSNVGGSGTPGQGFDGGNSFSDLSTGGGGGASQAGNDRGTNLGGDGLQSSIDGTPTFRAGGGTGGSNNTKAGGAGGGGSGGTGRTAGEANTGGGGGGGYGEGRVSGNRQQGMPGGSGIVIVRYRIG